MKQLATLLCGGVLLLGIVACSDDEPQEPQSSTASRTVLIYIGGENSLNSFIERNDGLGHDGDLVEMTEGAADVPSNCNLIVYVDDVQLPRIYKLENIGGEGQCTLVKEYDEDSSSADPAVLRDVWKYVIAQYPAESYGMVMWSHADGWLPANSTVDSRSIIIDNGNNTTSNAGAAMNIPAIKEVLQEVFGSQKLDFILWDACFMQSIEVAYEMRNTAKWLIGSPAEIPGSGAPYHKIIKPMFASSTPDIEGIVYAYYSYYTDDSTYGALLSAIDTSHLEELAKGTSPLLSYIESLGEKATEDVFCYMPAFSSSYPAYHDINGLMMKNLPTEQYTAWKQLLDKAVRYPMATEWWYSNWRSHAPTDFSQYCGLSMYVPAQINGSESNRTRWNAYLKTLDWYKATRTSAQ